MAVVLKREIPLCGPISNEAVQRLHERSELMSVQTDRRRLHLQIQYDLTQTCLEEIIVWLRRFGVSPRREWLADLNRGVSRFEQRPHTARGIPREAEHFAA